MCEHTENKKEVLTQNYLEAKTFRCLHLWMTIGNNGLETSPLYAE